MSHPSHGHVLDSVYELAGVDDSFADLYGGNFDEWQREISALFTAKGRPTQAYPSISRKDEDGTTYYHKSTWGDILDIIGRITPTLGARIPDSLEISTGQFYAVLKKLCEPFRLLELPAELRVRVYECAVGSDIAQEIEDGYGLQEKIPALGQTTHQLRQEVLPVYFASNVFKLRARYDPRSPLSPGAATAVVVTSWQHKALGSSAKHLRKFDLSVTVNRDKLYRDGTIRGSYDRTLLRLRFDKNRGLWIETAQDMYVESKKMLEEMVALAEAEREEHEFAGESILGLLHLLCNHTLGPGPGPGTGVHGSDWLNLRLRAKKS